LPLLRILAMHGEGTHSRCTVPGGNSLLGVAVAVTAQGMSLMLVRLNALCLSFSACAENLHKDRNVVGHICVQLSKALKFIILNQPWNRAPQIGPLDCFPDESQGVTLHPLHACPCLFETNSLKARIRVSAGGFLMNSALGGQTEAENALRFSCKMEMDSNHFCVSQDFKINTKPLDTFLFFFFFSCCLLRVMMNFLSR
jgi:hypothetical protein